MKIKNVSETSFHCGFDERKKNAVDIESYSNILYFRHFLDVRIFKILFQLLL